MMVSRRARLSVYTPGSLATEAKRKRGSGDPENNRSSARRVRPSAQPSDGLMAMYPSKSR